mmetsp:Transcript_64016/g.111507  ORF Transcript_64016/g.111507 Transcript_64016/m.111507 type:complete len:365 (+) Transcript_64016:139-1233(+)
MASDAHRPGVKRAQNAHAEQESLKRPCTVEKLLESVKAGIAKDTHVTECSRQMLCDMIPLCLGTPSDERHEFQQGVADMIRNALGNAEVSVAKDIELANKEAMEASKRHAKSSAEQVAKKASMQKVADAFEKAKVQWKKDNAKLVSIASRLDWVKDVQVRYDAGLREAQEQRRAVEAALQEHIVALMDSSAKEAGQHHLDALVQVVKREGIEDGLANSFPISAKKKPSARSQWENRVLLQLKAELTKRGRKLDEAIAAAWPPAQERAEAVASQRELMLEVRKEMETTAHALRNAELDVRDSEAEVYDAEVAEFEAAAAENAKMERQKSAAQELESFRRGPLAAFETLRTRRSPAGTAAVAPAGA